MAAEASDDGRSCPESAWEWLGWGPVDQRPVLWGTGGRYGEIWMDSAATVSMRAEVPEPLLQSMQGFIEAHPNWDQYRLFQAALAGFLVQNGVQTREITRCYLANLFPQQRRFSDPIA
jgi:hypothetical protein